MIKQINNIQLRAARHALNLSTKDIAELLGVAASTITHHECLKFGITGFNKFIANHSDQLINFFTENDIVFPDNYSIELKVSDDVLNAIPKTGGELTRFQLRVARYILNITQIELSKKIDISKSAINTHECKENTDLLYIYKKEEPIELKYKQWFLSHGIKFFDNFKVEFKNLVES